MDTTVVHVRDEYDIYIGRPSKWGNPFKLGPHESREDTIARYEKWIRTQPHILARLSELKGKRLACWCRPLACHGDVLVKLIKEMT